MTRVEVIWDDAHAKLEDISIEEARKIQPQRTHSIGWLIAQGEAGVVIAVDRWPGHDLGGSWHFIPRPCIVEMVELTPVDTSDYTETITGAGV